MTKPLALVFLLLAACHTDKAPLGPPTVHRPTAAACTGTRPASNCDEPGSMPDAGCSADSQCTGGSDGRCSSTRLGCMCSYDDCHADSDCTAGNVCDCADQSNSEPTRNRCVTASCVTDSDCGATQYCAPSLDSECGLYFGVTRWACTTALDRCRTDADCGGLDAGFGKPFCGYTAELGYWSCLTAQCAG